MPASPDQVKLVERVKRTMQELETTKSADYRKLSNEENMDIHIARFNIYEAFFRDSVAEVDEIFKHYPYLQPNFELEAVQIDGYA